MNYSFTSAARFMSMAMADLAYACTLDIIPEHKSKWVAQAHANVALARQANKNCNQHERRVLDAMQEDSAPLLFF